MVILIDRLSVIASKGELTPRYYNPGDVFDEVHFLLLNDDRPNAPALQPATGRAKIFVHNLPAGPLLFMATLAWTPFLLRLWTRRVVNLAKTIRPHLIRSYGNWLNGFAGAEIKRQMNIPFIISLHGNPDVDYYRGRRAKTMRHHIYGWACERIEKIALSFADFVIAVYSPIVPYLEKHRVAGFAVIQNAISRDCAPKENYGLDRNNVKLLCVGRQDIMEKDPSAILEAMSELPHTSLTIIGRGSLHDILKQKAQNLGVNDRVTFIPAMPNQDILNLMRTSDIYVYSSDNYEISKTTIEAALTGLPIILNDRNGDPAKELRNGNFMLVENTKEGFRRAIAHLIDNDEERERRGREGRNYALKELNPVVSETRVADIYKKYLDLRTEGASWLRT